MVLDQGSWQGRPDPHYSLLVKALRTRAKELAKEAGEDGGTKIAESRIIRSMSNAAWMVVRLEDAGLRLWLLYGVTTTPPDVRDMPGVKSDAGIEIAVMEWSHRLIPIMRHFAAADRAALSYCVECGHELDEIKVKNVKYGSVKNMPMCPGCGKLGFDPEAWSPIE